MNNLDLGNYSQNINDTILEPLNSDFKSSNNFNFFRENEDEKELFNVGNSAEETLNNLNPNLKIFLDNNREFIFNYYLYTDKSIPEDLKQVLSLMRNSNKKNDSIPNIYDLEEKIKIPGISSSDEDNTPSMIIKNFPLKKKNSKRGRSGKEITLCPHLERKHYAKNMCYNCYHSKGREKTAWLCQHKEKIHYAKGQCQNCYHSLYKVIKPDVIKKASENARHKKKLNKE